MSRPWMTRTVRFATLVVSIAITVGALAPARGVFGSCGDGVLDPGETCDDGTANGTVGSGCSTTCACVTPDVRQDIGVLTATDPLIKSYRRAVAAMQALPTDNPLSWTFQAAIHRTTLTPTTPQEIAAWNQCTHGSYYFWSWHRMYLYWFERIVRKESGDPCWALPYWNYTLSSERKLPPMFREPVKVPELYVSARKAAMNDGTGSLPAGDVDPSAGLALLNFGAPGGPPGATWSIESTPHDLVHGDVGGLMGNISTAAEDPIFYLHHSNIDRLWNLWLAQGSGRNDPIDSAPGDAAWKSHVFTFFDENGKQVNMKGCDVLRAASQLGYSYAGEPPQVAPTCSLVPIIIPRYSIVRLVHLPWPPELPLGPQPVSVPVELGLPVRGSTLGAQLAAILAQPATPTETIFLELEGIETPTAPGVAWEVYVGLPAGVAADPRSPFYVGAIGLFSTGIRAAAHHGFRPARRTFAINGALRAFLGAAGSGPAGAGQSLPITFVPHGLLIDGQPSPPQPTSRVLIRGANIKLQNASRNAFVCRSSSDCAPTEICESGTGACVTQACSTRGDCTNGATGCLNGECCDPGTNSRCQGAAG